MGKISFCISVWLMLITFNVKSQWTTNTALNTAVSIFTGDKYRPEIISDGMDGAIITWYDTRNGGFDWNIYAQRIDATGSPLWTINGVAICDTIGTQQISHITSDGAGGAIVAWVDDRNGNFDIYAQKINSTGVIQWSKNGVIICNAIKDQNLNTQDRKSIISDGSGGAIIAWDDYRSFPKRDIYCQRINSAGVTQWTVNGVAVCTSSVSQASSNCCLEKDGLGGAILTWQDARSGACDIFAQRINATGLIQWTVNGVTISNALSDQVWPNIVSDGNNGAIITWLDGRSTPMRDVYAQRITSNGVVQWTSNGIPISAGVNDIGSAQFFPNIISDDSNGAIITWHDSRNGVFGIYVQKINSLGAVQWAQNGNLVAVGTGARLYPSIISDEVGGAYVTWIDKRNTNDYDIYAQKINTSGTTIWQTNGVALGTAVNDQQFPHLVKTAQGVICSWADNRNGNYDIYAQNISNNGLVGVGIIELFTNKMEIMIYPNPTHDLINFKEIENTDIIIYNEFGNVITRKKIISNGDSIDISNLNNGIYLIEFIKNESIKRCKFIKQ